MAHRPKWLSVHCPVCMVDRGVKCIDMRRDPQRPGKVLKNPHRKRIQMMSPKEKLSQHREQIKNEVLIMRRSAERLWNILNGGFDDD